MTGLKAVVFDWAGTMIDFGSLAPTGVFVRAFKQFGISITVADARGPMGKPKRDHIADLMALPHVAEAWRARFGEPVSHSSIDRVFEVFVPMNEDIVADYAALIPGAAETVAELRRRGLKIGSTTGYTRSIMDRVLPLAKKQGYSPDNLVCAGDLPEGRPTPLMMYRTFADLGVYPPEAIIKVDDTAPGIAEGLAAGCWTVAVAASGNETGLSLNEWGALDLQAREQASAHAKAKLERCGAHYVIGTVADLLPVVDAIEARLSDGERPLP
jgi:phosphonoacetaldehyde hydrolase